MISLNWLPETAFLYLLIFARVGIDADADAGTGRKMIPARIS